MTNDDNAPSFKYKSNLIGNTGNNGRKNGVNIAVQLKYLSNFWRSLEMPLIKCKVELSLKWVENCELTVANTGTFKITNAKLYVPIITLKTEDNTKLSKLLSEVFKRSIYWNKYKVVDNILVQIAANNEEKYIRELIDPSYQRVNRLFVLAYNNTANDNGRVSVDFYKNIFFQELKLKIVVSKLMVEIFMISQLMTQLNI